MNQQSIGTVVESYIGEYGAFVNQDRAIPDGRDGLKPVHRRILWAMLAELHMAGRRTLKKSANVVGAVIGNYHPHGDTSTYQALVGLTHRRYPLVEGEGNWGIGNCGMLWENAAAYRYTECALTKLGSFLLSNSDIADTQPNFDGAKKEPVVLSARVPVLLMNGSEGIGVAARTNIPPHNLTELCKAIRWLIKSDGPEFRAKLSYPVHVARVARKLASMVPGPDYGTGAMISGEEVVARLFENGKGSVKFKCLYHFEEGSRKSQQLLVIDSLAPGFHVPRFLAECAAEQQQGHLLWAADESDLTRTRVVVAFRDAGPIYDKILPKLNTSISYGLVSVRSEGSSVANDTALAKPKVHTMVSLLLEYLDHHREMEERILHRDIAKAEAERSRLSAIRAVTGKKADFDSFTKILRNRKLDEEQLSVAVQETFELSEAQVKSLLAMPIRTLASVNVNKVIERLDELRDLIEQHTTDLEDIDSVVLRCLDKVEEEFGDARGTLLPGSVEDPELAADSPSKVMLIERKKRKGVGGEIIHVTRPPKTGANGIQTLFKGRRKVTAHEILQVGDEFSLVYSDGWVRRIKWAYIRDGAHAEWNREGHEIVAIISDQDEIICAADNKGKVAVVNFRQKKEAYQIAKVDKITAAVGMRRGDHLVVWDNSKAKNLKPKGRYRDYEWWAKKAKRPGFTPASVLPHARRCGLLRLKPNAVVLREDASGYPIPVQSQPKRLCTESDVWVIFDVSIVIFADGRKRLRPEHRVRSAIKRGENIKHILSWDEWEYVIEGIDEDDEDGAVVPA